MKKQIKKLIIILSISLLLLYFLYTYFISLNKKNLDVYFLDVGQGDAILIKTPYQQNIIIDMGNDIGVKKVGKIIPWWDKEIDLLIISHPHDDHILGVPLLIKKYNIKKIIFTGISYESSIYEELLTLAYNKKIEILIPQEEQKIILGEDCKIEFLYPQESLINKKIENLNNSSIVNLLDCQKKSFLFMGDAEEEVEKKILKKNPDLKIDVLKVGHHGSITSSHQEFIEKIKPKISIIMVGTKNKFNHPSLRIINRLKKIGSLILRTDLNGTINIRNNGPEIILKTSY